MLLWDLLDIRFQDIPRRCQPGLLQLNSWYHEQGAPTDKDGLIQMLDAGLKACKEQGFVYPKMALKRLKQMQRGEWQP